MATSQNNPRFSPDIDDEKLKSSFDRLAQSFGKSVTQAMEEALEGSKFTWGEKGLRSAIKDSVAGQSQILQNASKIASKTLDRKTVLSQISKIEAAQVLVARQTAALKREGKTLTDDTLRQLAESEVYNREHLSMLRQQLRLAKDIESSESAKALGYELLNKSGYSTLSNLLKSKSATELIVKSVTELYDRFQKVDKVATTFARSADMTRDAAQQLMSNYSYITRQSEKLGDSAKLWLEESTKLNQQFGISGAYSNEMLSDMSELTNVMKLEKAEQEDISIAMATTGKSAKDIVKARMGEVAAVNASMKTSINYRQVMKDMAAVGDKIRLNFWGNDAALAAAATKARALGVQLRDMEKVADSMLQFETSIQNQMQAEVLTGKQMNLEELRYQSLYGTTADIATELAKQVGSAQEFQKMNRIQAEGYAQALGMSRDEISTMLIKQQAINKFGKEEYSQKVELYKQALREGTLADFKEKQGKAAYEMLKNQVSDEERAQLINEKMGDQMQDLVDVLRPISKFFNDITQSLATASKIMHVIKETFMYISGMKLVQWLLNLAGKGGAEAVAKATTKTAQQSISNAASKYGVQATSDAAKNVLTKTGGDLTKAALTKAGISITGKAGTSLAGTAAMQALNAGTATVTNSSVNAAGQAGGGLLGKISGYFAKVKPGMLGRFLKGSVIGSAIEMYLGNSDIKGMIADKKGTPDDKLKQLVGQRVGAGLGSVLGGAGAGALIAGTSAFGIPSWLASGVIMGLGSAAGGWLGGKLAEVLGAEGLGSAVLNNIYEKEMDAAKRPKLDKGGVIKESGLVHADAGEVYTGSETIDLFKGMYNEIKAQNEILLGILRKDTTLVVDTQVMAKATGRAAVTSYGNVLNNPKLH